MEIKNKLVVGVLSALLALTGLACGGDDTLDAEMDVETPTELSTEGLEVETEPDSATETETETDLGTETETEAGEMETEATPTETETP